MPTAQVCVVCVCVVCGEPRCYWKQHAVQSGEVEAECCAEEEME